MKEIVLQKKKFVCIVNRLVGYVPVEKNIHLLDVEYPPAPEMFYDAQDPVDAEGDIQQLLLELPAQDE